ncbi:MAG TPA: hypothetical protein VKB19_07020 [Pedobacter sp.]|nr:hypothetical protein [Pedobacter sp.]
MKRELYIVLALTILACGTYGQTTKTGVLIVGDGNNAIGAGIQAAVSGVKTVVLLPGAGFELSPLNQQLNSGIAAEFLKRLRASKGSKDSTTVPSFDNAGANAILKTWMDSLKNITVIRSMSWVKLRRSGSGWNLALKDGRTIKAEVLVNADRSGKIDKELSLERKQTILLPFNYENSSYRSSIAAVYSTKGRSASILSLYSLLNPMQENLIMLDPSAESLAAGQAAGGTGAYAVFFKQKTSAAHLKTIQGELINYKLSLVPFSDVLNIDSNWKAIQFIGLTGILKAELSNENAWFRPEQKVSAEEIRETIKSYFYKAQLWFDDYKEAQMTIGSTLDMISRVGSKSLKSTEEEVKKKWKTTYHFNTEFEADREISRREFAVLVNEYLKPFDVNIDKTGRVIR